MVRYLASAAIAALLSASAVSAQNADIPTCGPGKKCPSDTPCCSAYGQCGLGAYCLGGCDPLFSHSLDSCVPNPICKSADYQLNNLDDIAMIDEYLGDTDGVNWVASGRPIEYPDGGILLTMAPDTVGTLLATTHYVWYGKISAKMTTSQGKGVVTAFIMMSDVKDEIDYEFVGVDINHAQTNFYSQGVTNYNNGDEHEAQNTVSNSYTYTIDWKPDSITWYIDDTEVRRLERSSTWNSTSNRFDYPQTPSRIMISLWPAGLPSNGEGTIEWAGGLIDWNSRYMQNGFYYARLEEVSVECYDPPRGANVSGSKSYIYTDYRGTNDTIAVTNKQVVLGSFYNSGEDPEDEEDDQPSGTSSATRPTRTAQTIPGVVGAGSRGEEPIESSAPQDSGSSNPSGTRAGGNDVDTPRQTGSGVFFQGDDEPAGEGAAVRVGGSVFAVVMGVVVGCLVL
ncbi:glycoside hydrolase family 16 protein [Patellaria atrata CBS 101060]|uniref:Glycoside hydrolase family 16 protein n=1 Tax=Patellaria atrata CBS 101060 TaxID=1346257 RepID=A0A9P4VPM4_9PEZI|nr:glycoside hydrolase family 16 protein [Patellaria atrata CBS 101060]